MRPYIDKYAGLDNYGKPKVEYVTKISALTDDALFKETTKLIWLSAYVSNNRRSDFHWQVDCVYDEWCFRNAVEQYAKAYDEVFEASRSW